MLKTLSDIFDKVAAYPATETTKENKYAFGGALTGAFVGALLLGGVGAVLGAGVGYKVGQFHANRPG